MVAAIGLGITGGVSAAAPTGIVPLDLRLRYEQVTQDNDLRNADALTLRARLGYRRPVAAGLTGFIEMESVATLIDDYAPERSGYAVVADPAAGELNQYGLRYAGAADGIAGLEMTLGRSRLILDNARWVGNVGWRQNEQTFDGVFLRYHVGPAEMHYAWLHNVNTVTASNVDLDAHLANATWNIAPTLQLTAYAYRLDFAAADAPDLDSFGLRGSVALPLGDALRLHSLVEVARQQAQTPDGRFSASYTAAELAIDIAGTTLKLGHERLGSDDGAYAVQTPLATKHAFQGWADVFLLTPVSGVRDLYASAGTAFGAVKLHAAWHEYRADSDRIRYGHEWNLSAGMTLHHGVGGLLKYARYAADGFGVDTERFWLQFEFSI